MGGPLFNNASVMFLLIPAKMGFVLAEGAITGGNMLLFGVGDPESIVFYLLIGDEDIISIGVLIASSSSGFFNIGETIERFFLKNCIGSFI